MTFVPFADFSEIKFPYPSLDGHCSNAGAIDVPPAL
jgi:hypothetical protein